MNKDIETIKKVNSNIKNFNNKIINISDSFKENVRTIENVRTKLFN